MDEPTILIAEITDPAENERRRPGREQFERNSRWLQDHWPELLPRALGKHLAVAGQEAFIADTAEEAIAEARAAHPEDAGRFVQYVRPERGPRIYGNRG